MNDNFFDLFGIPMQYQIDSKILLKNYRMLQREYHPDNAIKNGIDNQALSHYAALINQAFTTLKDPVKRGWYLFSFLFNEEIIDKERTVSLDEDFCDEQLRLRERLDDLIDMNDLAGLNQFELEIKAYCSQIEQQLNRLFSETTIDNHQKKEIIFLLDKLQFVSKILQSVQLYAS